jgi:hypothetical protein
MFQFKRSYLNYENRLRTGVTKTKANMMKWRYQKELDILYECSEDQSDYHLLQCILAPPRCSTNDLALANEKAIVMAKTKYLNIYFIFYIHILTYLFLYYFM